jgi:hypothetical protein
MDDRLAHAHILKFLPPENVKRLTFGSFSILLLLVIDNESAVALQHKTCHEKPSAPLSALHMPVFGKSPAVTSKAENSSIIKMLY